MQTNGSGTADLSYNSATDVLTWNVRVRRPQRPGHDGRFPWSCRGGANAGVLIWMSEKGGIGPVPSPLKGEATLSDDEAADLTSGNL